MCSPRSDIRPHSLHMDQIDRGRSTNGSRPTELIITLCQNCLNFHSTITVSSPVFYLYPVTITMSSNTNESGCLRSSGCNSGRHVYFCVRVCARARLVLKGWLSIFLAFYYNFIQRICWHSQLGVDCGKTSVQHAYSERKTEHRKRSFRKKRFHYDGTYVPEQTFKLFRQRLDKYS
jgi:hypothetical protein